MNTTRPPRGITARLPAVAFCLLASLAGPLAAHEFRGGDLELAHPSAPPTPPGVSSAAGYLDIINEGDEDDRLLGGSAPFAAGIELHRTTIEDDVSRMRRLVDGLVIPAGTTVRLEPGGTHLMFTGLSEPLPDGERRSASLEFERAGVIVVEFAIERPDTGGSAAEPMDHGTMDHGETGHGEVNHGTTDQGDMNHDDTDHDDTDHDEMDRGTTNPDETDRDAGSREPSDDAGAGS